MRNAFIFIVIISCISCNNINDQDNNDYYSNIERVGSGKDISINRLSIDTVKTNVSFTYSGDVFWKMKDDTLYLFDRLLGIVDIFNRKGEFYKRALGIGKGPNEVMEEIGTVCNFKDGWLIVDIYNVFRFSRAFDNKRHKFLFSIDRDMQKKKQDLLKNPNPAKDIELYVPAYLYPQMVFLKNQSVLIKVSCEYPDFRENRYYKESALIGEYDFTKGTITRLMGRYSNEYKTEDYTVAFANHYFTKYKNEGYLLSFGIDTLLYICDDDFKPHKAFGISGNMENTEYARKNKKDKTISHNFKTERLIKGYYTSIFYCNENNLTFRVYKTGIKKDNIPNDLSKSKNPSRMQIYKGTKLIGDVPVPEHFEIIGHKGTWFYADGYFKSKEDGDEIGFYRFRIE